MTMKKFAMVTTGIAPNAGGGVGALFKVLKTAQKLGYKTSLRTVGQNYTKVQYEKSIEIGRADKIDDVTSLYEFFEARGDKFQITSPEQLIFPIDSSKIETGVFRYSNWFVSKYKKVNMNSAKTRSKEVYFDFNGTLNRITEFDKNGHFSIREIFFTAKGQFFLEIGRKWVDGKGYQSTYFEVLSEDGLRIRFDTEQKLWQYFLDTSLDEDTIIWIDHPALYRTFINWNTSLTKVINFQSTHLYPGTDKIKPGYDSAIESIGKEIEALVVLTDSEKQDLDNLVDSELRSKVIQISHATDKKKMIVPLEKRPQNKFLSLGRIDDGKRVHLTIEAFKLYKDKYDSAATLDIYGHGPNEESVRVLVDQLGLSDDVSFKGFTNNVDQAYQESTALLFTSVYEGFGMTLMEAKANGTPSIAFDIKYGPRDIIVDSEDGFVIQNGDVEKFVDAMHQVVINQHNMREKALKNSEYFSMDKYNAKIEKLLGMLSEI